MIDWFFLVLEYALIIGGGIGILLIVAVIVAVILILRGINKTGWQ